MKNRWSLKEHNEGASLIAVLISIMFVLTIAGIVLNLTITNIRMRMVEESGKRNFYSAEEVMDELSVGLNNAAAQAMQKAYNDILMDYRNIASSGADLQAEFTDLYMENLTNLFWDKDSTTRKNKKIKHADDDVEELIYVWGYYNQTKVSDNMPAGTESFFVSNDSEAVFTADYIDGIFTLENVKIAYEDSLGYATTISTNIVFHTPVMNFGGNYRVMDYMKYALIADKQIQVFGANNVKVDGSAYAGYDGILVDHGEAVFDGNNIVTRGDIEVASGSHAVFGSAASRIWAENIVTSGSGSGSSLTVTGNIYVADDLNLNGNNSSVTLNGSYYGYNFQEKYDGTVSVTAPQYSSAIIINGKSSRLDMSGLDYLLLAGRTYISRGSSLNDVVLGESLSVRTNQLAYYIPEKYLDVEKIYGSDGKVENVTVAFKETGAADYSTYAGVDNILDYLKTADPIAVYRFLSNGDYAFRYYLNFKDDQSANDFFHDYWSSNSGKLSTYGEEYADAIILPGNRLYTLKGDLMYRNVGSNFAEEHVEITPENWQAGTATTLAGIYYTYADRLAINYMSLQSYLEDSHKGITSSNIRFYDGSNINKKINPLTSNLLDLSLINSETAYDNSKEEGGGLDKVLIAVVDNDGSGDSPYQIPEGWQQGIIIATGDVNVTRDFKGMIIAGGTIIFDSASDNVTVTADELAMAELFAEDVKSDNPRFTYLFNDYNKLEGSVIGVVRIDDYLTYENWTRTEN